MLLCAGFVQAQDLESLKSMKADKQAAADAMLAEVADLDKQIQSLPGWKTGGVGIIGADLSANDNWYAINTPFAQSTGLGLNASAFANNNQDKWFWNNLLTINLKQTKTNLDSRNDQEVKALTDAFDISSLAGYKLAPKWALSAEAKFTTTLLAFNKPGKLTVSAGATWLPIPNAVVIFHPLAYEKNFPGGNLVSAAGCKIGATYSAAIIPGVAWSTNLSGFIPYGGGDGTLEQYEVNNGFARTAAEAEYDFSKPIANSQTVLPYEGSDLANWTWLNTFSTNIFKGIGLGLNVGLRKDKQVADRWQYNRTASTTDFSPENPLQFYYSLGLSYTL